MRFRRTEAALMDAMAAELAERPLPKVTVAALSRRAVMNKSTFYLHYADVHDLAGAWARREAARLVAQMDYLGLLWDDPEEFARRLAAQLAAGAQLRRVLHDNGLAEAFLSELVGRMADGLAATAPEGVAPGADPEVAGAFVVGGVTAVLARHGAAEPAVLAAARFVRALMAFDAQSDGRA